jgi:hypothetical protein
VETWYEGEQFRTWSLCLIAGWTICDSCAQVKQIFTKFAAWQCPSPGLLVEVIVFPTDGSSSRGRSVRIKRVARQPTPNVVLICFL